MNIPLRNWLEYAEYTVWEAEKRIAAARRAGTVDEREENALLALAYENAGEKGGTREEDWRYIG